MPAGAPCRLCPVHLLIVPLLILLVTGCESDSDRLDGRYPPPRPGNQAIVTLEHRQQEVNREALSYGKVQVLFASGSRTVDAIVSVGDRGLEYDSRELAYYDQLLPPLVPGSSYRIRVRSATWGEDTTYVYLPGDFRLYPSALPLEWAPGMEYDFSWEEASRAHRYIVRVRTTDGGVTLLQDTLATEERLYSWTIPEEAGGQSVAIRVTAERLVNDPPIWSGWSRTYTEFQMQVGS